MHIYIFRYTYRIQVNEIIDSLRRGGSLTSQAPPGAADIVYNTPQPAPPSRKGVPPGGAALTGTGAKKKKNSVDTGPNAYASGGGNEAGSPASPSFVTPFLLPVPDFVGEVAAPTGSRVLAGGGEIAGEGQRDEAGRLVFSTSARLSRLSTPKVYYTPYSTYCIHVYYCVGSVPRPQAVGP